MINLVFSGLDVKNALNFKLQYVINHIYISPFLFIKGKKKEKFIARSGEAWIGY